MTSETMPSPPRTVAVLIAAHDAEATLARAIRSAIAQPEVAEVIVIDDASRDKTRQVAEAEAEADPEARVRVLGLETNAGPGGARNRGLDAATADHVAVLDSDDFFLPGRFARLLAGPEADLRADNIVFLNADRAAEAASRAWPSEPHAQDLSLVAFVRGNLRRRGVARGELGFLKPVMSRRFLERTGLRYDAGLRLGEDYDLYVRMMLAGATMRLGRAPGYAAVVRAGSLSARHRTEDLLRLEAALQRHLDMAPSAEIAAAMRVHLAEVRRKHDHRKFLDLKREAGLYAAARFGLSSPGRPGPIAAAILRDKLRVGPAAGDALPAGGMRLLLPVPGSDGRA